MGTEFDFGDYYKVDDSGTGYVYCEFADEFSMVFLKTESDHAFSSAITSATADYCEDASAPDIATFTVPVVFVRYVPITSGNFGGPWASFCISSSDPADVFSIRVFGTVESDSTSSRIEHRWIGTENCEGNPNVTYRQTHDLVIGADITLVAGQFAGSANGLATSRDSQLTLETAALNDVATVNAANAAASYGFTDWQLGVPKDITNLNEDGSARSNPVVSEGRHVDESTNPDRLYTVQVDEVDPTIRAVRGTDAPDDLIDDVTIHDDFASGITEAKWPAAGNVEDAACDVEDGGGKLAIDVTWSGGNADCRYRLANPSTALRLQVDVRVSSYSESAGNIRARLNKWVYNDGSSSGGGDLTGDVSISVNVENFVSGYGRALADVRRCDDSGCVGTTSLAALNLGLIALGDTRTIALEWDGETTFTAQMDSMRPFIADVGSLAPNAGAAGFERVELAVRGTGSPVGDISVEFDNFRCEQADGSACQ